MSKSNCSQQHRAIGRSKVWTSPFLPQLRPCVRRDNCAGEPAFLDRTGRAPRLGNCQTFFRESEYGEHLLTIDARKPVEKLIDCRPGFQILKKGFHRYPRVFESASTAQSVCGTLHRWACGPIHHGTKLNARGRSATGPSRTGTMARRWGVVRVSSRAILAADTAAATALCVVNRINRARRARGNDAGRARRV